MGRSFVNLPEGQRALSSEASITNGEKRRYQGKKETLPRKKESSSFETHKPS
jgi:hypothetical protein